MGWIGGSAVHTAPQHAVLATTAVAVACALTRTVYTHRGVGLTTVETGRSAGRRQVARLTLAIDTHLCGAAAVRGTAAEGPEAEWGGAGAGLAAGAARGGGRARLTEPLDALLPGGAGQGGFALDTGLAVIGADLPEGGAVERAASAAVSGRCDVLGDGVGARYLQGHARVAVGGAGRARVKQQRRAVAPTGGREGIADVRVDRADGVRAWCGVHGRGGRVCGREGVLGVGYRR